MQELYPLTIGDVALAARNVLDVLGIDEEDLKAPRFENLVYRDPIDACGLHRHRPYTTRLQPVCQLVKISGECFKRSYRLSRTIWRNGNEQLLSSDINASCVRMKALAASCQFPALPVPFLRCAPGSFCRNPRPRGYETSKLLNGIVTEVNVTTDLYANLRPTLIDGLRVEHQCRLRAVAAAGPAALFCTRIPFIRFLVGKPMQAYQS
jgi:hypothetical protein